MYPLNLFLLTCCFKVLEVYTIVYRTANTLGTTPTLTSYS